MCVWKLIVYITQVVFATYHHKKFAGHVVNMNVKIVDKIIKPLDMLLAWEEIAIKSWALDLDFLQLYTLFALRKQMGVL